MNRILDRLGRSAATRPWRTLALWAVVATAMFALAGAFGGQTQEDWDVPSAQAQRGLDLLREHLPSSGNTSAQVVVHAPDGEAVPAAELDALAGRLATLDHVLTVLPPRVSEDGATADAIGAGELVVPLAVIDVRKQAEKDPDYLMGIEDVLIWEKRFKKLPKSCCVAMLSGWGSHVGDAAKYTGKDAGGTFHFPGVAPELAEWLLKERQVQGLAVDTLSLDNGASKDFKTHHICPPDAGVWKTSPISKSCRLRKPSWWWACPR